MYSKLSIAYLCLYFEHTMSYKAIIIGASGLIGSELLKQISESSDFHEIVIITRRSLDIYSNKVRQVIIDFDHLDDIREDISGDIIFSCLGSTKGKTPDAALYRKIELDYTLKIARIGLTNGAKQFHYVSSLGADSSSSNSYLKLKGEVEVELKKLGYEGLHIYQPSYLTGNRQEKRIDDTIMRPLMFVLDNLLIGKLKKYKSIAAEIVARAMLNQSLKNNKGTFTYPSDIIKQLA